MRFCDVYAALCYLSYFSDSLLGKAAQLAGYNRLDFLDVLAERGIVAFDYDASFVDSELQGVAQLAAIHA